MATKTITIMEDAYEMLVKSKMEGESFSDTIRRVVGKDNDISDYFGVWSEEYADSVEEAIRERRKENATRREERIKRNMS